MGIYSIPSGAVAHWTAEDLALTVADGGQVTAWKDRMNGYVLVSDRPDATAAPTFASKSTINDKPAVRFDGTNDNMYVPGVSWNSGGLGNEFTIGIVWEGDSWSVNPNNVIHQLCTLNGMEVVLMNGNWHVWVDSGATDTTKVEYYRPHAILASHSLAGNETLYDGARLAINQNVGDAQGGNAFELGSYSAGTSRYFKGDIAEVVIWNKQLSATERDQWLEYTNEKYGLLSYDDVVRADAPVSWYRFTGYDPSLVDEMGGSAAQVIVGSAISHYPLIMGNTPDQGALDFQANTHVRIPAQTKTAMNDNLTIEAWVQVDAYPTGAYPNNVQYILAKRGASGQYGFSMWDGGLTFFHSDTGGVYKSIFSSIAPQPEVIYHIVGQLQGTAMRFYVNGELISVDNRSATLPDMSGPIEVGTWYEGNTNFFDGAFDEIALYSRVLTEDEIMEHWTVGMNTKELLHSDPWSKAVTKKRPTVWLRPANTAIYDARSGISPTRFGGLTATYPLGSTKVPSTPSGAPTLPASPQRAAYSLDGVDDYAKYPNALRTTVPTNGWYALETWVVPDVTTGSGWRNIVHRADTSGNNVYCLQALDGKVEARIDTADGIFRTPAVQMVAGQLYHIVMLVRKSNFIGDYLYLYVNGEMVSLATTGRPGQVDGPLYVGAWNGTSEFWDGRIGDVVFYDHSLSHQQVIEHYRKGMNIFNGALPQNETFVEHAASPWPPGWQLKGANLRGVPAQSTSFSPQRGQLWAKSQYAANGGAWQLYKNDVPKESNTDVTLAVYPATPTAGESARLFFGARMDGEFNSANASAPRTGYVVRFQRNTDGTIPTTIIKFTNGIQEASFVAGAIASSLWSDTVGMKVRMKVVGAEIKFKVWAVGDPEPTTWTASWTDPSTPHPAGWVGVGCEAGSVGNEFLTAWDDITISGSTMKHYLVASDGKEVELKSLMLTGTTEVPLITDAPAMT